MCHFCRMNYRVLLVVVLSGAFFSLGWCLELDQESDQELDFEALKMEAFRTPDSVHAVVLEVYVDAWVEGRGGGAPRMGLPAGAHRLPPRRLDLEWLVVLIRVVCVVELFKIVVQKIFSIDRLFLSNLRS